MNIIHNIFSVKNENSHKVVRICFIKLKLKNYKKIAANLKNSNLKLANDNKKLKNANIKLKTGSEKLKIKNKEYLEAIKTNPEMFEIYVKNPELAKKDEINAPMVREQIQEILNREEFPLFQLVEIETMNRCNGECAFCPVNRHDDPREFKMMEDKLFYNIISQLKELNFKGRVCPFSNNEPLMDKRIFEFTDYIRKELPECHISLFTNGKLLNLEKFNKLIPNCDTFCIDIYYKGKEEIPQNIKPVVDLCRENKKLQNIVKVQFVNQDAVRNNRGGGEVRTDTIYTSFKHHVYCRINKLLSDLTGSFLYAVTMQLENFQWGI